MTSFNSQPKYPLTKPMVIAKDLVGIIVFKKGPFLFWWYMNTYCLPRSWQMELRWHCCMLLDFHRWVQLQPWPRTRCRASAQTESCVSPLWKTLPLAVSSYCCSMIPRQGGMIKSHVYRLVSLCSYLLLLIVRSSSSSHQSVEHTSFVSTTKLLRLLTTPA